MLPIEPVFQDIQRHLTSTFNIEVSDPQTWLERPPLEIAPENTQRIVLEPLDSGTLVQKNREQRQSESAQDNEAVLDKKSPGLAPAQVTACLASQSSIYEQSLAAEPQPIQPKSIIDEAISVQ
jgi:hypothetical protein